VKFCCYVIYVSSLLGCSICERVGVDWNGSSDSVICSDNIDLIYHTLFFAMIDYTLDSRGDVGRW